MGVSMVAPSLLPRWEALWCSAWRAYLGAVRHSALRGLRGLLGALHRTWGLAPPW